MSSLYLAPASTRKPFVIAPYFPEEGGRLVPVWPSEGPCADRDEGPCRLVRHLWRDRKTGPCFPLAVLRCASHGVCFTLYPPGHVPYGRRRIARVAFDGEPVPADRTSRSPPGDLFRDTVFEAALDGAAGRAWPRECAGGSDRWWGTQGRDLERSARWTGVACDLDDERRLSIAQALGVDTLLLIEGAETIRSAPGYRSRGRAVTAVLAALSPGRSLPHRLALARHLAGLGGKPIPVDPASGILRRRSFPSRGTNRPPPATG